jgi:hypothetical protein
MLRVGFEPTIPVFERAKTVRASDHAATVIDQRHDYQLLLRVRNIPISILNTADIFHGFPQFLHKDADIKVNGKVVPVLN